MQQTVNQVLTPFQKILDTSLDFLVNYSFQVIGALLILAIGLLAGRWTERLVIGLCQRKRLDVTLSKFFGQISKLSVFGFALLVALGKFGITIAPLIAAIGATAFGVTYAIQGPLSNYAAGLAIILGRPFVVGDTITVKGVTGLVTEVRIGYVMLLGEDRIKVLVPCKHIVGEIIHNSGPHRIVEGMVGIAYGSDPGTAVAAISKVLSGTAEISSDPSPQVGIQGFGDSAINISYRYWVATTKQYSVLFTVNRRVLEALKAANVSIPFPQREVRLLNDSVKPAR